MAKVQRAIEVKDLVIRYKGLQKFSIKKAFFKLGSFKPEVFEAVRGISFTVNKGEILGIVGKNGSGKSTLLRSIARIFSADEGSINLFDNSVSLLSIGVGFQPKLTGKENVYLSGMLLGFSEEEITAKYDEITSFAELGKFIDKPVSSYSSGMYSKLAFSITAILEADIILIDEVLSVGDIHFKAKSYNKMKELINEENRTVIIVSHNTSTLQELSDRVMWIHDGKIKEIGDPETVLTNYEDFMRKK